MSQEEINTPQFQVLRLYPLLRVLSTSGSITTRVFREKMNLKLALNDDPIPIVLNLEWISGKSWKLTLKV